MTKTLPYRQQKREIFSQNLKRLLLQHNKTQADLVNDLEISQSTISDWFSAKSMPRDERLEVIAEYLGVTTNDLLHFQDEFIELENETFIIPVYKSVSCGNPTPETDTVIGYETLPDSWRKRGEFFAVKAKGDSMYPTIMDGDTLIVKKQQSIVSGDIAIVKVNGDEATCKKILIKIDGVHLQPINGNYETMYYTKERVALEPVEIIGRVVEVRKKL